LAHSRFIDATGLGTDAALYSAKREGRNRVSIIRYESRLGSTFEAGGERLPSLIVLLVDACTEKLTGSRE
jgi:hypothetical protein